MNRNNIAHSIEEELDLNSQVNNQKMRRRTISLTYTFRGDGSQQNEFLVQSSRARPLVGYTAGYTISLRVPALEEVRESHTWYSDSYS